MTQAQKEIDNLNKQFVAATHGQVAGGMERYAEQYARDMDAIIARHGAKKEILHTAPNGISKIRVTDSRGEVVAEWHDVAR